MTNAIGLLLALSIGNTGEVAWPKQFDAVTVRPPEVTIVSDARYPGYVRVDLELVSRTKSSPQILWSMGDQEGKFANPYIDTMRFAVYFSGDDLQREAVDATVKLRIQNTSIQQVASTSEKDGWVTESLPLHVDLRQAAKRSSAFEDEWKFAKLAYFPNQMCTHEAINVPIKSSVSLVLKKMPELPNKPAMSYASYLPVDVVFNKDNYRVNLSQEVKWGDPAKMAPGTYLICLVVNGKEVDWRPFTVAKEGEGC